MKKFIALILAAGISAAQFTVFAANETIDVQVNEISVYADGKYIDSDNFLYRDRTYLPLRSILECLSCSVSYDEVNNTVRTSNSVKDALNITSSVLDIHLNMVQCLDNSTIAKLMYDFGNTEYYNNYCDLVKKCKELIEYKYESNIALMKIYTINENEIIREMATKAVELHETAIRVADLAYESVSNLNMDLNEMYELSGKAAVLKNDIRNLSFNFYDI